jgi:hypothetical protein
MQISRRAFLLTTAAAATVAAIPAAPEAPEVGRVAFYLGTSRQQGWHSDGVHENQAGYARRARLMAEYGNKAPPYQLGETALREIGSGVYLSDVVIPPMPIPAGTLIQTRTLFRNRQGMQEMRGSARRLTQEVSSLRIRWADDWAQA